MVKLGDTSVIRTATDSCFNRFNVISHIDENKFVVTEGTHIATVYDLSAKTPLKSWNFPESSPLSAPVIFDKAAESFVAVQQSSVILRFHLKDDICEASKVKLKDKVYCVLCHPKFGTIVLFSNGYVKSLRRLEEDSAFENKCNIVKKNENIVWAHIDSSNNSTEIVHLVTETENGNNILRELSIEGDDESVREVSNVTLKQKYNLFTFTENGCVIAIDSRSRLVNLSKSESPVLQLPSDYSNQANSILWMTGNKLIISVKIKSEQNNFKLEVWDLKFKLNISESALDLFPLSNAVSVHNSNIFVCCSKGILMIPFDEKQVSLASVMGKAATPEDKLIAENTFHEILNNMDFSAPQTRERCQVRALQIALKEDMSEETNLKALTDILKYPFCQSFAISSLKDSKYTIDEVTKLLQILNSILLQVTNLFIIDWMCVILDAYFKPLILSSNKASVNVLRNISETVSSIGNYCEKIQELKHFLEGYGLTINRTQIQDIELPKYKIGQYCIEVIYF